MYDQKALASRKIPETDKPSITRKPLFEPQQGGALSYQEPLLSLWNTPPETWQDAHQVTPFWTQGSNPTYNKRPVITRWPYELSSNTYIHIGKKSFYYMSNICLTIGRSLHIPTELQVPDELRSHISWNRAFTTRSQFGLLKLCHSGSISCLILSGSSGWSVKTCSVAPFRAKTLRQFQPLGSVLNKLPWANSVHMNS